MKTLSLALAATALVAASLPAPAFAQAPVMQEPLPIGRCINVGNSLEGNARGGFPGTMITSEDMERIAAAGFATIRLPVRWSEHARDTAPYTINPEFMGRVRTVVDWAREAGLNVMLNNHHYNALHAEPAAHSERLAGFWTQIAQEFAGDDNDHLWFEIDNEPNDQLTNAILMETLGPSLAEIRKVSPQRPVIIGGEFWSGISSLATLELPDDAFVYPTFHYYEPFAFTHQGATWVDPVPPLGREYGLPEDAERLENDFELVRAFIERTGKTPFIGESGAHTTVSLEQRVAYHRAIREAWDTMGVDQCAWAYANTFPFFDHESGQWHAELLDAWGVTPRE